MAKLPKLVLRQCQPHSKEWVQLLKLVLAAALQKVKVQYSILENAELGRLALRSRTNVDQVLLSLPSSSLRRGFPFSSPMLLLGRVTSCLGFFSIL